MRHVVLMSMALLIVGCVTTSKQSATDRNIAPEAVLGPVWQWQGTDTAKDACTVPTPERYTLQFLPEGRVQARFDCNRGGGTYAMSAGELSFGPLISTRMACPPDSMDARYMKDLGQTTGYYVQDGVLHLLLSGDNGIMHFRRQDVLLPQ